MSERTSAGILLYRLVGGGGEGAPLGSGVARLEVLLAHPGGPHFANRDLGDWTIPKGEPDDADEPMAAVARREFAEETGMEIDSDAPLIDLGTIVQKGGKIVYAWAVEGSLDPVRDAQVVELELALEPDDSDASSDSDASRSFRSSLDEISCELLCSELSLRRTT